MCAQFAFNLLLAKTTGAAGVGEYYIFLAVVLGMGVFAKYGTDVSAIRLLAVSMPDKNSGRGGAPIDLDVDSLWSSLFVFVNITVALVCVFGSTAIYFLGDQNSNSILLGYVLAAVLFQALLAFSCASLRGLKQPVSAALIESLGLPVLNISAIVGLYLLDVISIDNVIRTYVLVSLILYVSAQLVLLKSIKPVWPIKILSFISTMFLRNLPLLSIALMTYISHWSAIWIIEIYMGSSDVGIYNIAWRLVVVAGFVGLAVKNINAPYFSRLYAEKDVSALQKRASAATSVIWIMSIPLFLILYIFSEKILGIFGQEFISGARVLQVLVLGQIFRTCCGPVGYMLLMTGHEREYNLINTISAAVIIISALFLVSIWGVLGVAIAYSVGTSLQNIIAWAMVKDKVGVMCLPFYRRGATL